MSYLTTQRRRRVAKKPMGDIGEMIDAIRDAIWDQETNHGTNTQTTQCTAAANAQTAALDAKATDLSKNWKPSGFYSPDQVTQLVNGTINVLNNANAALAKAISSDTLGDTAGLPAFVANVNRKIAGATAYRNAASSGQVVNAPGLKDWIVKSMLDASSAMNAAYIVSCLKPWWAGIFNAFSTIFNALYSLAKGIVGVVVDVGTAIVKVADNAGEIWTIVKYGALAAGAAFLYVKFSKGKASAAPVP